MASLYIVILIKFQLVTPRSCGVKRDVRCIAEQFAASKAGRCCARAVDNRATGDARRRFAPPYLGPQRIRLLYHRVDRKTAGSSPARNGAFLRIGTAGMALSTARLPEAKHDDSELVAPHAVVLVLGRLEQSPRMLAHASALAAEGFRVTLLGYGNVDDLNNAQVRVVSLSRATPTSVHAGEQTRRWRRRLSYPWRAFCALVTRLWLVRRAFDDIPPWDLLVAQNPPAFPTLMLVPWLRWHRARPGAIAVLDWHNTTHSIMAINRAPGSAVALAARLEYLLGARVADAHLAVTGTLGEHLLAEMALERSKLLVLPDRPLRDWTQRFLSSALDTEQRYHRRRDLCRRVFQWTDEAIESAIAQVWLCSATSWSPDEPMELLFQAVVLLEKKYGWSGRLFITGRGPLRSFYVERFWPQLGLTRWSLHALWLPSRDDYAQLLSCADAGISMHQSSSGMDLPMKVFDMWGCGLPVIAYAYPCLEKDLPLQRLDGELDASGAPSSAMMGTAFTDLSSLVSSIIQVKRHQERYRENVLRVCATDPTWRWESQYVKRFLPFLAKMRADMLSAATETTTRMHRR